MQTTPHFYRSSQQWISRACAAPWEIVIASFFIQPNPPALPVIEKIKSRAKSATKQLWIIGEETLPDSLSLRMRYFRATGTLLHLNHPRSFTEKIQWMKRYYRRPIMTQLADKFASRSYVEEKIGRDALNDLYGVWEHPDDIPFEELPDSFVMKVSSASHANIICPDKSELNIGQCKAKLARWMAHNYYDTTREWAYKDMKPVIVCERFLTDGDHPSPMDYKFYCFDGKPELIEVDIGRSTGLTITMMGTDWKRLPFTYDTRPTSPERIPRPANLGQMLEYAAVLSKGFPFMRVDFYSIDGQTIFGEITWYPGTGLARFLPSEYDFEIGKLLHLPNGPVTN